MASLEFLCGVIEGFYGQPWSHSQRLDLFKRMQLMSMNSYLYAPKDDEKHRKEWRALYNQTEIKQLEELINQSKINNVEFIYAISPGLDIEFSNKDDVEILKLKLEQLKNIGCRSFALLFDDIDPQLSTEDKKHYESSAHAQASISNICHAHLINELNYFLFCPTEYCKSRAKPTIESSPYLTTIGNLLHPTIHILWTGQKVISQDILPNHLDSLITVLHRKPLIWDNIHANDYDEHRLFLGPFQGRPLELRKHLSGLMTNPNCEYEVNHVAMFTLAEWARLSSSCCESVDENNKVNYIPRDALLKALEAWLPIMYTEKHHECESSSAMDALPIRRKSVTEGILAVVKGNFPPDVAEEMINISKTVVTQEQEQQQQSQVNNVLLVGDVTNAADDNEDSNQFTLTNSLDANVRILDVTHSTALDNEEPNLAKAALQTAAVVAQIINLQTPENSGENQAASMATSSNSSSSLTTSHAYVVGKTANSTENLLLLPSIVDNAEDTLPKNLNHVHFMSDIDVTKPLSSSSLATQEGGTTADNKAIARINVDDLLLLVDFLYLPYEYGPKAEEILKIAHWLKFHATKLKKKNKKLKQEWLDKILRFHAIVSDFDKLCLQLNDLPNRILLYELYPYVWDIRSVLAIMNSYFHWLKDAGESKTLSNKESQPSWVLRGGLTADLLCILPLDEALDLVPSRCRQQTELLSTKSGIIKQKSCRPLLPVMLVRPYRIDTLSSSSTSTKTKTVTATTVSDKSAIYSLCRRATCWHFIHDLEPPVNANSSKISLLENVEKAIVDVGLGDLAGDRYLGYMLEQACQYAFVVENDKGQICGYALAVDKAEVFWKHFERKYVSSVKSKYTNDMLNSITDSMAKNICERIMNWITRWQPDSSSSNSLSSSIGKKSAGSATAGATCMGNLKILYHDYPALIVMDFLSTDAAFWQEDVAKRLLACLTASLKTHGVPGVHCRIPKSEVALLDQYKRLGFKEIVILDGTEDICLGRLI